MIVKYTDEFKKRFYELPISIQKIFYKQEIRLKNDSRDPRLHTKKLEGDILTFSFRITRVYRALFLFDSDKVLVMLTIGHRKDVYRKL